MKTNFLPTDPQERIEIIDLLRGFAILGIIFNNILYFSGYQFIPFDSLKLMPTFEFDEKLYNFLDVIISGKFYRLFSILFGAGFYLQYSKNKDKSPGFLKVYRNRLFILLMIGFIHSLIWFGDILFQYAIIGFILILFRNQSGKKLLSYSIFFLLFFILSDLMLSFFYQNSAHSYDSPAVAAAHVTYPDMSPSETINIFKNGSIGELFSLNIHNLVWKWMSHTPAGRMTNTLGLFLLGYYFASTGFFTKHIKSNILFITCLITGSILIFSAKWIGGSSYQFPPVMSSTLSYELMLNTGLILLSLFYASLIAKISATSVGGNVLKYLIPVGRTALTNYLTQTFLCIVIFYNFGFNLIGKIGLVYSIGIVLLILASQIIISNIWVKYYRYGPFEWLWRSLTYRKWIKIRQQ